MSVTDLNVKCSSCTEIVQPQGPKNKTKYGLLVSIVFGLFFGFGVGGIIGIATAGVGIPAILPLGLLGAYVGLKLGRWIAARQDGITCPDCGYNFFSS